MEIATDEKAFKSSLNAEVPDIEFPFIIVMLAPVVLAEALQSARFQTKDQTLNIILEDARI